MDRPVFFGVGLYLSSETVKDALAGLRALGPEDMQRLAAGLASMARDFTAAAEFAQDTGVTERQIARVISLSLSLHMASAANQVPLAAAADEAREAGLASEDVEVLRQFLGYLAQEDDALGAYLGRTEAVRCGIPAILDLQLAWGLRAAFGDAVHREGEPTDISRDLMELIPVGILKISAEGADPEDHVFQVEASDLDWMMRVLETARDRLASLSAYAFSQEEDDADETD